MNINMPISAFGARGVSNITISVLPFTTGTGTYTPDPNSIDPGDVIIGFDDARTSPGNPTSVAPSGAVTILNQSVSGTRKIVYYKICDGTEDQGTLPRMQGSIYTGIRVFKVKGNIPITSVTVKNLVNFSLTASDPPSITLSASGVVSPAVGVAGYTSSGDIDPITFSPAQDIRSPASASRTIIAGKVYNKFVTPVNHTIDMGDHGVENGIFCCYLEVS